MMTTAGMNFINVIMKNALANQAKIGVPAAVVIAQACLETGYGKYLCKDINSGKNSMNLFNIKGTGPAGYVLCWTTEYYNGVKTRVQAKFRAYNSYLESFEDHSQLMLTNRYKPCMDVKNDPEEFAHRLQACGYATDPKYAEKLISIMKTYRLLEVKVEEEENMADSLKGLKFESDAKIIFKEKKITAGIVTMPVGGKTFVQLTDICNLLGLKYSFDNNTKTVTMFE